MEKNCYYQSAQMMSFNDDDDQEDFNEPENLQEAEEEEEDASACRLLAQQSLDYNNQVMRFSERQNERPENESTSRAVTRLESLLRKIACEQKKIKEQESRLTELKEKLNNEFSNEIVHEIEAQMSQTSLAIYKQQKEPPQASSLVERAVSNFFSTDGFLEDIMQEKVFTNLINDELDMERTLPELSALDSDCDPPLETLFDASSAKKEILVDILTDTRETNDLTLRKACPMKNEIFTGLMMDAVRNELDCFNQYSQLEQMMNGNKGGDLKEEMSLAHLSPNDQVHFLMRSISKEVVTYAQEMLLDTYLNDFIFKLSQNISKDIL